MSKMIYNGFAESVKFCLLIAGIIKTKEIRHDRQRAIVKGHER
jgi:hypothetical protein